MRQGKVVDGRGNGVGGLSIAAMALGADGRPAGGGGAMTLPDGTFQISGLQSVPHRVIARSDVGMFGLREGVRPGDKDVVLTFEGQRLADAQEIFIYEPGLTVSKIEQPTDKKQEGKQVKVSVKIPATQQRAPS